MWIKKFRLQNYKSFIDSGEIELGHGINIIVGKNSTGKTALLEALALQFSNVPHLSRRTIPNVGDTIRRNSIIELDVAIEQDELTSILRRKIDRDFVLMSPMLIESHPSTMGDCFSMKNI